MQNPLSYRSGVLTLSNTTQSHEVFINSACYLKIGSSLWVDWVFSNALLSGMYNFHASANAYTQFWNDSFGAVSIPCKLSCRQIWQAFVQESIQSIAEMSKIVYFTILHRLLQDSYRLHRTPIGLLQTPQDSYRTSLGLEQKSIEVCRSLQEWSMQHVMSSFLILITLGPRQIFHLLPDFLTYLFISIVHCGKIFSKRKLKLELQILLG